MDASCTYCIELEDGSILHRSSEAMRMINGRMWLPDEVKLKPTVHILLNDGRQYRTFITLSASKHIIYIPSLGNRVFWALRDLCLYNDELVHYLRSIQPISVCRAMQYYDMIDYKLQHNIKRTTDHEERRKHFQLLIAEATVRGVKAILWVDKNPKGDIFDYSMYEQWFYTRVQSTWIV
tara:strand:+ start:531 stop:1067 length:537 start_codon:yes stop_codon:yes gene_type:complete